MMAIGQTVFLFIIPAALGLGLTVVARWRGLSPWTYWSLPIGAAIPWCLATLIVIVAAMFVEPKNGGEAAVMVAMLPVLAMFVFLFLGIMVSLVMGPSVSSETRLIWSLSISAVPAILIGGYLTLGLLLKK